MDMRFIGASLTRAVKNIAADGWLAVAATAVMAVSLMIFGLYLLVFINVRSLLAQGAAGVSIHVFLRDDASADQVERIRRRAAAIPDVGRVRYVSKDQAWSAFRRDLGHRPDLLAGLDHNPLPASLVLGFRTDRIAAARLDDVVRTMGRLPGVEDVAAGGPWSRGFTALISAAWPAAVIVALLLFGAAAAVIALTLRLCLMRRRQELGVMALVGATRAYIRTPILIEGALTGAAAAFLSLAGLYALFKLLAARLDITPLIGAPAWSFLPPAAGVLIVLAAVGSGLVGSLAAVGGWRES